MSDINTTTPAQETQVEFLQGSAQGGFLGGSVAQRLLQNGFRVEALRTNGTLRKDEWKLYDTKVIEVARSRLVGVADLLSSGLTFPIANALGVTRVEWEKQTDMDDAVINMSGVTEGTNDRVTWDLLSLPLPIIHRDFTINIRALHASRNTGQPLDTTQAAVASRKVSEKTEAMLFNGATELGTNAVIYGYRTAQNRNTGSISNWASSGVAGTTIVTEILAMIAALVADNMLGPYMLYVPASYWNRFMDDYKANSDRTILERILAISGISGVKMSTNLPDGGSGEVVLVQMTSDVIDMCEGMQPTMVEWNEQGGMVFKFKVMSIMAPRTKYDANSQCGIAHYHV